MVTLRRSGFTLLEVLVALVLVLLVMVLLARGMTLVTETVTRGERRIDLHRRLETARRVFREDVAAMAGLEAWGVFVGRPGTAEPVIAFLRYRNDTEGETETEWVQYRLEPHPAEPDRLSQWVRYARPADDRATLEVTDPVFQAGDREVVLDHLISAELVVQTDDGDVSGGTLTGVPRAVDIRWAATAPPFPVVNDPADGFLDRVEEENGEWIEFRCRPEVSP